MPSTHKFLIVDDNPDSRFLLVKTLLYTLQLSLGDGGEKSELRSPD